MIHMKEISPEADIGPGSVFLHRDLFLRINHRDCGCRHQ